MAQRGRKEVAGSVGVGELEWLVAVAAAWSRGAAARHPAGEFESASAAVLAVKTKRRKERCNEDEKKKGQVR